MRAIAIGPRASSPRLRRACARFGLRLTHADTTPPVRALGLQQLRSLRPGCIALLTGRSGCGKSAMLHALRAACEARGEAVWSPPRAASTRVIDSIGGSLHGALGTLARVGLADATILPRRVRDLSEGERARFAIALACRAAAEPVAPEWVLIDEFLTVVDRSTARAVAAAVRRVWRAGECFPRLVVATAHADLHAPLRPALHLDLDTCEHLERQSEPDDATSSIASPGDDGTAPAHAIRSGGAR